MLKQHSTLMPKTATMSYDFFLKISSFRQVENVQFVLTLSKESFELYHSTVLLRHCCWCGRGLRTLPHVGLLWVCDSGSCIAARQSANCVPCPFYSTKLCETVSCSYRWNTKYCCYLLTTNATALSVYVNVAVGEAVRSRSWSHHPGRNSPVSRRRLKLDADAADRRWSRSQCFSLSHQFAVVLNQCFPTFSPRHHSQNSLNWQNTAAVLGSS